MTGGSLTASGSGVSLTVTGTTTVSGASLEAEAGAMLNLPQLTTASIPTGSSFRRVRGDRHRVHVEPAGPDRPGPTDRPFSISRPANGGQLLMPALSSVTATSQDVQILADGASSKIDLSGLTSLAPGNVGDLSVTNQATILDPKLTSLTDMSVTIDGTGTMAVGQWTTLTTTSVEVTGGTTTLSSVTSVTLPNNEGMVLEASGSGATLSLPALTSLGQLTNYLYLEANQGGQLLLPALDVGHRDQPVLSRSSPTAQAARSTSRA